MLGRGLTCCAKVFVPAKSNNTPINLLIKIRLVLNMVFNLVSVFSLECNSVSLSQK